MNKTTTVSVKILGKTYHIKCPDHEVESLKQASVLLEEKMHATRESAHLLSHDKIAVITSLNLAHEVMLLQEQTNQYMQAIQQRLHDLQSKVDSALLPNEVVELFSAE